MALLEQLKQKLKMLTVQPVPFDPARFADPVALQTQWTPARAGGSNFRTHKLAAAGPNRVEFRATVGAIFFCLVFLIPGLAIFAALSASWFSGNAALSDLGMLIPMLLSLISMLLGGYLLAVMTAPIVFEKGRGAYWKGRKGPDEAMDTRNSDRFVRLDQVHAVQLIAEYVSGKNSYYSYELNLVLQDGKRATVIDHGNRDRIREDGKTLALFLGKPLWDATEAP